MPRTKFASRGEKVACLSFIMLSIDCGAVVEWQVDCGWWVVRRRPTHCVFLLGGLPSLCSPRA